MSTIHNQDVSILGDLTLNPTNAQGNYITLDVTNVLRFRTPTEVAAEVAALTGSDKTYVHDQLISAAVWNITHNLGKRPSVMVVDSGDSLVMGQIDYIDDNNLTLTFNSGFNGYAYFN